MTQVGATVTTTRCRGAGPAQGRGPGKAWPRPGRPGWMALGWILLLALFCAGPALAQEGSHEAPGAAIDRPMHPSVTLDGQRRDVDAWPAVTVRADASPGLSIEALIAEAGADGRGFTPAQTPWANLGPRRDSVWLRIPVRVAAQVRADWVLDIDYPSLDRVEVYLVQGGAVRARHELGDQIRFDERPLPSRSHATRLPLTPGADQLIYLRISTRSTMIVPVRLIDADLWYEQETRMQLLQGLLAGIALCLVLYALGHWLGRHERLYLVYAVSVGGVSLFFFSYFGLGSQHLWPGHAWLADNAAPFWILFGLGGTALLVDELLDVRQSAVRLSWALKGIAGVSLVMPLLFAAGLVPYRLATLMATLAGPAPIVLAAAFAWRRARAGDEAARYVLLGWTAYAVGVLVQVGLLRGWIDSNAWTQHAFQAGWMCEILAFLRVLGVRAAAVSAQAERAEQQREQMARMAHSDPLTGLPNRRGLDLALEAALLSVQRDEGLAVYVIDLDGFKQVNDRLGHDAGDALLKAAAGRLQHCLRSGDVVARLGGDEFVIVARSIHDEPVAWRLGDKLLAAFATPFDLGAGQSCEVGLTVGFALAPQDGVNAAELLKRADAAMYAGKQAGKGRVRRGGAAA
jgi:diguanylate cyclase (GGDEF)-like protein